MRFIIKREKIVETNQSTEELIDNIKSFLEKGDINFLKQSTNELIFVNKSINFANMLTSARKGKIKIETKDIDRVKIQMEINITATLWLLIIYSILFFMEFLIVSWIPSKTNYYQYFFIIFISIIPFSNLYSIFYRLPNLFFKKILHKD